MIHAGEATIIDRRHFEINFPFGFLPDIKQSETTLKVGIGYGRSEYSWRYVKFYDSSCRTCNEGIVDPSPVRPLKKEENFVSISFIFIFKVARHLRHRIGHV